MDDTTDAVARGKGANHKSAERETLRIETDQEELAERIARAAPKEGRCEPLEDLVLNRSSTSAEPLYAVSEPCLCVIAQGAKEVRLGDSRYQYDPYHYLLITSQLPLTGQVLKASRDEPYLSLRLDLDASLVSSVMVEAGYAVPQDGTSVRALDVSTLDASLLSAVVRLVRLLDAPDEAPVLAPLIKREIIYRLLQGEQSRRLRHLAVLNGQSHRISQAIERLHADFDQSIPVEHLAEEIGMSTSSFYQHFKAVTDMTPLQFQKQLQLQEARRLMLSEDLGASSAGYRVGYEDASHFSREYKRLFDRPPMRDVKQLQEAASGSTA